METPLKNDVLRTFYDGLNHREDIEAALGCLDPDVELHPGVRAPDAEVEYRGRTAFREFFEGIISGHWETVAIEVEEMIETADGRILCIERWRLQGRDEIELNRDLATLFTLRDGLISRIDGFTDKDEALKAAGLSE